MQDHTGSFSWRNEGFLLVVKPQTDGMVRFLVFQTQQGLAGSGLLYGSGTKDTLPAAMHAANAAARRLRDNTVGESAARAAGRAVSDAGRPAMLRPSGRQDGSGASAHSQP